MRTLAFMDHPEVIETLLTPRGLWPYPAHAPASRAVAELIEPFSPPRAGLKH